MNNFLSKVFGISLLTICLYGCEKTESLNIRQELDEITSELDTAWNIGDAISFANLWTEDAINVSPMGETTEGRKNIEQNMAMEFSGPMKGTIHKLTIERASSVSSSVAVADGIAEVTMNNETWKSQFTAIFSRDKNNNWKVAHMRAYIFLSFN